MAENEIQILQGNSIAPGVVIGPVHMKEYDLGKVTSRRVPNERVEEELNRFREALEVSRRELQELKTRLKSQLQAEEGRIFDTHLAYLKDPIFVADVENLILNQQMNLEAAIAKVISDFDRIFKLVESEYLRERAVDLRDVAIRVLRNLNSESAANSTPAPSRYILAAKELSLADLFNLSSERVEAILTEEGGATSHASILARSMRIPTVIGIKNLLTSVKEGDILLVDGAEGVVRVNPDEKTRAEFGLLTDTGYQENEVDNIWINRPAATKDGSSIVIYASCSNHTELEQALQYKMDGVGLYRTEMLFMLDRKVPTEDLLLQHYKKAIDLMGSQPVIFRLLDIDSSMRRPGITMPQEQNPALGLKSLRYLFKDPAIFRTQIRALLRASVGKDVRILVPFVTGVADFRRVKEAIFEERWELRKGGLDLRDSIQVGACIEVPSACLMVRDLSQEVDFFAIGLDNLIQYSLAADRGNENVRELFQRMHPAILRSLRKVFEVAEVEKLETFLIGETAMRPEFLPFLIGIGARRFSLSPVAALSFKEAICDLDTKECRKLASQALHLATTPDIELLLQRFQHRES